MIRLYLFCGALGCGLVATVFAQPSFQLGGPEVAKLDWNVRALQAVDIDRDGRNDLVVLNNDHASIDILYQIDPAAPAASAPKSIRPNRWEPVVEDARFRKTSITTGTAMYDLVTGDFNGDGRTDFAYTGAPQALTVRYGQADGGWEEKKIPDAPEPLAFPSGLRVADLDNDGRHDLVQLGPKEVAVFYQDAAGVLGVPIRFPLPEENGYGLELFDLDGDSRIDLVYLSASKRDAMHVRRQTAAGKFGPEESYEIKSASSTLQMIAPPAVGEGAKLTYADSLGGQLQFLHMTPRVTKPGEIVLRPRVFAPRAGGKTPLSFALGDFDGDGRTDVAAADPDGARVFLYFRQPDGGFSEAKAFPSLAEIKSLAALDWDGDGRDELFAASAKEQVVGVASLNAEGRLLYPQPLPITGKPLAIAAGEFDTVGRRGVAVLREDKGKRACEIVEYREGAAVLAQTLEISGLKTDPRAVALVDANQDGLGDLAVSVPLDVLRLYLQQTDGSFIDAAAAPGFRKSLLDRLDLAAVTTGDLDGDGWPELLTAAGGFARGLRVDATGALTVVDQFNARDPSTAEIATALVLPPAEDEEGRPAVVLYDRKGERFEILKADPQGVYHVADVAAAGRLDVVGAAVRSDATSGAELFLFGKDVFWWVPVGGPELEATSLDAYATDLPEIDYDDVIAGDFDGDGVPELIAIDAAKNLVEILARDGEVWRSRMHFKVFDTDEHYQGRQTKQPEPRETLVADVTGDGKSDLILLVHDRVLVYPQE